MTKYCNVKYDLRIKIPDDFTPEQIMQLAKNLLINDNCIESFAIYTAPEGVLPNKHPENKSVTINVLDTVIGKSAQNSGEEK